MINFDARKFKKSMDSAITEVVLDIIMDEVRKTAAREGLVSGDTVTVSFEGKDYKFEVH